MTGRAPQGGLSPPGHGTQWTGLLKPPCHPSVGRGEVAREPVPATRSPVKASPRVRVGGSNKKGEPCPQGTANGVDPASKQLFKHQMVQAPTPVTVGGKERLLTGDSVLEEVNLVGVPLGGSCSLTQRLRGETLEKSKCGSGVKFTESGQDCRVPGAFLQAAWDCVLRPPGKRDHSLWSGAWSGGWRGSVDVGRTALWGLGRHRGEGVACLI